MKLLILLLLNFGLAMSQAEIDYQPKSLGKTLHKAGIENLSLVEELTFPDSIRNAVTLRGKFFQIPSEQSSFKYIYIGRVNSCRAGGCSVSNNIESGGSEYFDYFILFDSKKTVQEVKVFNYQATHGQEVTVKSWLKQFIGHSEDQTLAVNKNIDGISGATISVYAITADIEAKTKLLNRICNSRNF